MKTFKNIYLYTVDGGGLKYVEVRGVTENNEYHTFDRIYFGTRRFKSFEQAEIIAKKKMVEVVNDLILNKALTTTNYKQILSSTKTTN